jgi:hypothetical protein
VRVIPAILLAISLLTITPSPAPAFESGDRYGARLGRARSVDLADLAGNPAAYTRKRVRLRGTIADVCPNSGCWIVVSDGDRDVKVTFRNHAFSVPKDVKGRDVVLEGVVTKAPGRRGKVSVVATGLVVE